MKKLIYKEDHQMYYFIAIVFETDCNLTIQEMELISYRPPAAGRLSTGFEQFKQLMEAMGYLIKEIERYEQNTIPKNNTLEIIKGATGNY